MTELTRVLNAMRRRIVIPCLYDRPAEHRNAVFLAGTARSGTTWVSEILNYRNEFRTIFEPFNPTKVPAMERFGIRRYLRPDEEDVELRDIADRVVSGRIHSNWTNRFNRRLFANRRLIKDVRANLMLKWLHNHFPCMPIILLLRHPCAVVHSYRKQGWYGALEPLLSQQRLVADFLSPHEQAIRRARTPLERAAYIWCIETMVPLKQFKPGEIHLVFYENVVVDGTNEIERLFSFIGNTYDPNIIAKVARPSPTSRRSGATSGARNPIESWRREIDSVEERRILEIVRSFGLDAIYSGDPMPDPGGVAAIMGAAR